MINTTERHYPHYRTTWIAAKVSFYLFSLFFLQWVYVSVWHHVLPLLIQGCGGACYNTKFDPRYFQRGSRATKNQSWESKPGPKGEDLNYPLVNDHIAGWNIKIFIGNTSTHSGSIFHCYVRLPECIWYKSSIAWYDKKRNNSPPTNTKKQHFCHGWWFPPARDSGFFAAISWFIWPNYNISPTWISLK